MIPRLQFGSRDGVFDFWVSRPGIDVRFAQPGQLLLGGGTGVNQVMAAGRTLMHGGPAISAGQRTVQVGLPGLAAYSNLLVHGQIYRVDSNTGQSNWGAQYQFNGLHHGSFRVIGGVLHITTFNNATLGGPSTPIQQWASWAIFKAQY